MIRLLQNFLQRSAISQNGQDVSPKGAAMAAKARLMLYAASPLYNGCDLYKGQMKNLYGDFLFHKVPILKNGKKPLKLPKTL
ncbi:hypothetical protein NXW11_24415 [Bacteroides thetaiotaomicron]|uniref:hypothetical protein n=1 Tax=Bacteroides thetaiotaomicron TaxID=818 RepID=UPI0021661E7C|nr:hypothetical protein [Bacteroides thetaiotaomicron]MCS2621038.1 hypothetical protein [Bacteroides thetaiotaomicron]